MVKHVVMWNIKEGLDKVSTAKTLKDKLEGLVGVVPTLIHLELGTSFNDNPTKRDVILYSEFKTKEDYESYLVHPDHKEVGSYVKQVVCDRIDVDYEVY